MPRRLPGGVTIDGNNKVQLITISSPASVEFHGLTFTRGDGNGSARGQQ